MSTKISVFLFCCLLVWISLLLLFGIQLNLTDVTLCSFVNQNLEH